MSDLEIWAVIAVLVVATAATRSSFWLVGHHITIPKRVQEVLRYAPACALAAIVAPDLLLGGDGPAAAGRVESEAAGGWPPSCSTWRAATCCKPSCSACWCSPDCAFSLPFGISA